MVNRYGCFKADSSFSGQNKKCLLSQITDSKCDIIICEKRGKLLARVCHIKRWKGAIMYGAILGDMIGALYEFERGNKTKDFPLFSRESQFTDDSVMTFAVTEALLDLDKEASEDDVHREVISSMRAWGKKYPYAGYGARFINWLFEQDEPHPYGSYGNGSAMRVSAAGWMYDTIEERQEDMP